MRNFILLIPFLFSLPIISISAEKENCVSCHTHEWQLCANSEKSKHHFYANRELSDAFDSKAFSSRIFSTEQTKYEFYKENNAFKISTTDLQSAEKEVFEAKMAIGVTPLVQYVVETKPKTYQVLSVAYDPQKDEFFDVFNGESRFKGEWGHWQSKGMNWNSNCAYCHTTDFKKNYDFKTDCYDSKFASQAITCTQCHPALPKECNNPNYPILKEPLTPTQRMHSCASCHSRREQLNADKFKAGDDYFDSFRPELPIQKGIYYADGKVKDEDFVFSSFMMSRQYTAGLTCIDCHDRHMMRISRPIEKNELCLTCHAPEAKNFKGAPTIIPQKHSFHKDNDGNLCVNCHMPKTTYMARDQRYDHGFTSPDPVLTRDSNIPNACSQCHNKIDKDKPERNLNWLVENFEKQYGSERFLRKRARSIAVSKAHDGDVSLQLKDELVRLLKLEENHAWQATLLALLSIWSTEDDVAKLAKEFLKSESALVRSTSIRLLSGRPDSFEELLKSLTDKSACVRIDSAFALGDNLDRNSAEYKELIEYLDFNTDRPLGILKRADFALRTGNFEDAKNFAKSALKLEQNNPALEREVALILFKSGFADESLNQLKEAKKKYPKSSEISYTLALFYAEMQNLDLAILELENTVKLNPNFSRAWYNLSVAQFKKNKIESAINSIDKAISTDPSNALQYQEVKNFFLNQVKQESTN